MSKGRLPPHTCAVPRPSWTNLRCRKKSFRGKKEENAQSRHLVIWDPPEQYTKYQLVYLYALNMCIHALKDELWAWDAHFSTVDPPPLSFDEITLSKFVNFLRNHHQKWKLEKEKQRETNSLHFVNEKGSFVSYSVKNSPSQLEVEGKCLPTYRIRRSLNVFRWDFSVSKRIYFSLMSWTNEILVFFTFFRGKFELTRTRNGVRRLENREAPPRHGFDGEIRWKSSEGRLKL